MDNEPKMFVDLFTLMFMKGAPQFVAKDYLHGCLLGVNKGAMVENPETIRKSSCMFLTRVESAINELQLINQEKLVNEISC